MKKSIIAFNTPEAQKIVDTWVSQFKDGYFPTHQIITQASEELGEIGRELSHLFGLKKKKKNEKTEGLKAEVGGFIFTLVCLINKCGIKIPKIVRPIGSNEVLQKITTQAKIRENPFIWQTRLLRELGGLTKQILLENISRSDLKSRVEIQVICLLNELSIFPQDILKENFTLDSALDYHISKLYERDNDRFGKISKPKREGTGTWRQKHSI